MRLADIEASIRDEDVHHPRTRLVCLENTQNVCGGLPLPAEYVRQVADLAHGRGLKLHVDGARLFNAAVAQGVSAADLAAPADTVMFCLSKGLGAPVGSLLCGPADVIAEARGWRARWGGGMRQAGIIAAAGIVALETMVDRLADDHVRARSLADALAQRWPGSVDPERVQTNIVCAELRALPDDFVARLERAGVRAGTLDPRTFRIVTHKEVDDAAVAAAVRAFDEIATG
jgi:threonine aldolase